MSWPKRILALLLGAALLTAEAVWLDMGRGVWLTAMVFFLALCLALFILTDRAKTHEVRPSSVSLIALAIRQATQQVPTQANVDQVIADTIAALWPPEPQ